MTFDMQEWLRNRDAEHAAKALELRTAFEDLAIDAGWSIAEQRKHGLTIAREGKEIRVDLSGGIVCTLVYSFGDGRHFSLAAGDERRRASGMEMSEILTKWIEGREPDTRTGAP